MHESEQAISIAILLAAALVGGMIAHRLRQPMILGYLVVGVGVGPYALGLVDDIELVESMATIGVALLMFTLGLEVSINQLRQVGRVGYWGGLVQIVATCGLGILAGLTVFDWSGSQSVLFGLAVSLSSTMVCLKILMERGELDSVHGRIMVAILVLQDIAVVLMVAIVPVLDKGVEDLPSELGLAIGKAAIFVGFVVLMGVWGLPWLLGRIGGVRSRELFLLSIMVICLGAALGTYIVGLSAVFGAFLIGLALRESRYGHRALAEITPLRDIFAALFFVSLGMLLDPEFVGDHGWLIVKVVLLIMAIKFLVTWGIVRMFGFNGRIAMLTGAGLLQIGEFSFILAQIGVDIEVASDQFYSLLLAAALITMVLTPLTISASTRLHTRFMPAPARKKPVGEEIADMPPAASVKKRRTAVIAGYGRVGSHIARGLDDAGIPYIVIEIDPQVISVLRRNGVPCTYGDASNMHVIEKVNIRRAKLLVVTFPDPVAVVTTVKTALEINPNLKVVARVHRSREAEALQRLGVEELISPEYEASFRFLKRVLNIYSLTKDDRKRILADMRRDEGIDRFSTPDEE